MKPNIILVTIVTFCLFLKGFAQIPGTQNFWFVAEEVSTSIPTGMTITNADQNKYVVSIYDDDYEPEPSPLPPATLLSLVADGSTETLIDIQGVIGTLGSDDELTVSLNYTATDPVDYPAFSQTISIPSSLIEGGGGPIGLTLSYDAGTTVIGDGTITATIAAASTLNVKKLDVYGGGFNDPTPGYPLAAFSLSTDDSGGAGTVGVRIMTGIPDRKFGDGVHDFLYAVATSPTGKQWLTHNLGAAVTRVDYEGFNPLARISDLGVNEYQGSMFQYGRDSDGHEVYNYPRDGSNGNITGLTAETNTANFPNTAMPNNTTFYWYRDTNNPSTADGYWFRSAGPGISTANLWNGVDGVNNPCPFGYRLPTEQEAIDEVTEHRRLAAIAPTSTLFEEWKEQPPQLYSTRAYRRDTSVRGTGAAQFWIGGSYGYNSTYTYYAGKFLDLHDSQNYSDPARWIGDNYIAAYGAQVRCIKD